MENEACPPNPREDVVCSESASIVLIRPVVASRVVLPLQLQLLKSVPIDWRPATSSLDRQGFCFFADSFPHLTQTLLPFRRRSAKIAGGSRSIMMGSKMGAGPRRDRRHLVVRGPTVSMHPESPVASVWAINSHTIPETSSDLQGGRLAHPRGPKPGGPKPEARSEDLAPAPSGTRSLQHSKRPRSPMSNGTIHDHSFLTCLSNMRQAYLPNSVSM